MSLHRAIAARAERFLAIAAVAGLILIAFVFAPGMEMFRTAKEAAMRVQAILSLFALAVAIAYGGTARIRELLRDRAVVVILAGALLCTILTTLTSQRRLLSIDSLVTVICSVILFIAVWYVADHLPITALLILVPAAAVNAILAALQELGIWNPFTFMYSLKSNPHLATSALLGNPNDVGGYLALCAIILFATTGFLQGRLRWVCATGALIALMGVVVSQSRTGVLTIAAAGIFLAFRRSRKTALIATLVLVALIFVAMQVDLPGLTRVAHIPSQLAQGQWDALFSDRLPAFATAVAMFRAHPLLGVGPGTYKFFYMPYRIHLNDVYPKEIMRGAGVNFAEAHNDHLQLLAETGIAGYALFVAACVVIALRARRNAESDDERVRFAAHLAIPFVITIAVLALAFFPLQIASTRHLLITTAALILGWSRA